MNQFITIFFHLVTHHFDASLQEFGSIFVTFSQSKAGCAFSCGCTKCPSPIYVSFSKIASLSKWPEHINNTWRLIKALKKAFQSNSVNFGSCRHFWATVPGPMLLWRYSPSDKCSSAFSVDKYLDGLNKQVADVNSIVNWMLLQNTYQGFWWFFSFNSVGINLFSLNLYCTL